MNIKKRTIDVHIIESNKPSETDAEAQALASVLASVLTISGISAHRYYPKTQSDLAGNIQRIVTYPHCIPHHRHFLPLLHFALHAGRTGVFVGNDLITWRILLDLLLSLRERLEGNLLICMSACQGFYGYRLACSFERYTYHFLVGPRDTILWQDTVLAYHVFYHCLFFRKATLPIAVATMNSSLLSRRYSFDYTFGSEVQQNYKRRLTCDENVVAVRRKQHRLH